jgi:hypothetical protein
MGQFDDRWYQGQPHQCFHAATSEQSRSNARADDAKAYGNTAMSLITSKDFQNDVPMQHALQQSTAPKTTKIATGGLYMKAATLDSLHQRKKEEACHKKDLQKVPPAASITSGSDYVVLGGGPAGLAAAVVTGGAGMQSYLATTVTSAKTV